MTPNTPPVHQAASDRHDRDRRPAAAERHPARPPAAPGVRRRPDARASSRRSPAIERHGPLTLGALAEHERVAPAERHQGRRQARGRRPRRAPPRRPTTGGSRGCRSPRPATALPRARSAQREDRVARGAPRRRSTTTQRRRLADALDVLDAPHDGRRDDSRSRHADPRDLPVAARPQLPPVLQRPADLAGRQLAHARRPDAARAASSPTAASRSARSRPRSSVRCCSSARGPASSPTAPTSASCS